MAYILSKLHTAVDKTLSCIRENKNKDELIFVYTLELALEYLSKIEVIITRDKDIFGYPIMVVPLQDSQWNYFNELYCLLKEIYKDFINKMICPAYIRLFNELADNLPLISTLEKILNSLEKSNEPTTSN